MHDALLLARWRFAFTVSFHIIFPTLSIGLALFLAIVEALALKPATRLEFSILEMEEQWLASAFS